MWSCLLVCCIVHIKWLSDSGLKDAGKGLEIDALLFEIFICLDDDVGFRKSEFDCCWGGG